MLEAPNNRSSSNAESQQGIYWRDTSVLSINGPMISKKSESPDYSVGLGAQLFSSGKHEIDFTINRRSEGILYIGVAVPHIAVDKTWCRRDCTNQAWYYFGTGLTNALRNGWDDVVSKEVGGPEMKVPKLQPGDKVRVMLDMDAGAVKFAKFSLEDACWKDLPGKITGISEPVVAACCIQEKGDGVVICGETVKFVPSPGDPGFVQTKKRVNRYANVQSKLASLGALKHLANNGQGLAKEAGHTGEQREQEGGHEANQNQTQSKAWATKATLHQGLQELNPSDKKEERARVLRMPNIMGVGVSAKEKEYVATGGELFGKGLPVLMPRASSLATRTRRRGNSAGSMQGLGSSESGAAAAAAADGAGGYLEGMTLLQVSNFPTNKALYVENKRSKGAGVSASSLSAARAQRDARRMRDRDSDPPLPG